MRFDLHCHIVPGVDDGSRDETVSRSMFAAAKRDGIEVIAATSHFSDECYPLHYEESFQKILPMADEYGIRLIRGCEYDLRFLDKKKKETLQLIENSEYLLIDMNQNFISPTMTNLFFTLKMQGMKIIFAHPERMLQHGELEKLLKLLVENGIFIQVDTGSIVGRYGKAAQKNAFQVLDAGVCHLLGNDAHRPEHFRFGECREFIDRRYGKGIFELLTEKNPEKIFSNGFLEPMPRRETFWDRVKARFPRF